MAVVFAINAQLVRASERKCRPPYKALFRARRATAGGEISYLDTQIGTPALEDISPSGSELLVASGAAPAPLWIVPLPIKGAALPSTINLRAGPGS